jgi:predicted PurR-regulated permease PerM
MAKADGDRGWPPVTYWMKATAGVLIVLALAQILLAIGNIVVLLLVSLVLAMGFHPAVAWLERRGLRRGFAVAIGLIAAVAVVAAFMALVLPDVITQLAELVKEAPRYLKEAQSGGGLLADLNQRFDLSSRLQSLGKELPATVLGLLGSLTAFIFSAVTVLILTIYFVVNMPRMKHAVARVLRRDHREDFEEILEESIQRVGGYVLGNLATSAIAGILGFVALLIIGVPFAAALAFFVALMDLIPTVGALIAAAVSVIVAGFGAGLPEAIATGVYFLIYQQVENYLIQPRVMQKAIDMSPAVVIVAILIGGSLLGVIGALLAIPVAAVIKVAFRELYLEDRMAAVESEG